MADRPFARQLSRRRFLTGTALVGGVALLQACSSAPSSQSAPPANSAATQPASQGGSGAAQPTTAANSQAAPAANSASTSQQKVSLVSWFTDRRTINDMTKNTAIPDFQKKNPNITINMQFVPESEIQQKLLTAKTANNAPDVTSIDETFLNTLWKNNVLKPIPEQLINVQSEMGDRVATLYRLPEGQANGKYYALPNGAFGAVLYYNKKLLQDMGSKPEDIPKTWPEFIKWAQSMTIWKGDTLQQSGFAFYGSEGSVVNDYHLEKGGPIDGNWFAAKDKVRLADTLGVESWQFVMDLYDKYKLDSKTEGVLYQDRFGQGHAVTLYSWSWFNGFMETQYQSVDWDIMLPPNLPGNAGLYGDQGPDVGFCVATQKSGNEDASWTFWRYLVGPDYLKLYCKLRGVQPSLKSMWDDADFATKVPQWGALAEKMQPGKSIDLGFNSIELGDIMSKQLTPIRDDGKDIMSVLKDVETNANKYLASNPQWSVLSAKDYQDHPSWLTATG